MIHPAFVSLLVFIVFTSCTPRKFLTEIYTSDFEMANEGEVIQIPTTIEFSFPVKDKDDVIKRAQQKTLPFLSKGSTMELSTARFGKTLTIQTKFPMGNKSVLAEKQAGALFHIVVEKDRLFIVPTKSLEKLNETLKEISFGLDVDLPPTRTVFRIISDSRNDFTISAIAVFSNNKAYLGFDKTLKRRDSVEIEFSGDDGSVYKEINPFLKYSAE